MTATAPQLDGIVGWVVDLMETLGAPGVGLAIALENVFPPLPSEVFLPLAGFAASRGELSLVAAIVWTTIGSVVGALALYGLGAALGRHRLRAIADRMPLVDVGDIDKAEAWFARHGPKAVFFGRMVPLVRSMISVPAGVERMNVPLFLALTAAGSLIWNSIFVVAGYLLGESWHVVETYAGILSKVVLAVIAIAVVAFVVLRIRRARRPAEVAQEVAQPAEPPAQQPVAPDPAYADAPTEQIPVVRAMPIGPVQQWAAESAPAEWGAQPTRRLPVIRPDMPPPPRRR
ncbi:MAG TPA: DedA family protein [Pseudonocardia sp.]|jgi:membrane protein DedA with SNARE-associated domain|uniref:DedA family protein n=1 Tax=Pseudonocardia sp. TaxID=60912 RepID=UPI002B4AFCA3|nr:DedA family protein [Pseudonocardia sp.]HLU55838.1 DedA family protein [Pseudonocardia sp.]